MHVFWEWGVTITLGDLGSHKVHRHDSHDRSVLGLFPGLRKSEVPVGEIPQLGTTFLNAFMEAEGDYPVGFRPPGWVHSTENYWWDRMWVSSSPILGIC